MEAVKDMTSEAADPRWLEFMDARLKDALRSIEDTSKQLASLSGLVSGVYFGAVSVTKMSAPAAPTPSRMLFLIPMVFWLGTLLGAVLALVPRLPSHPTRSPLEAQESFKRIIMAKNRWLQVALICFAISLVALAGVLYAVLSAGT